MSAPDPGINFDSRDPNPFQAESDLMNNLIKQAFDDYGEMAIPVLIVAVSNITAIAENQGKHSVPGVLLVAIAVLSMGQRKTLPPHMHTTVVDGAAKFTALLIKELFKANALEFHDPVLQGIVDAGKTPR